MFTFIHAADLHLDSPLQGLSRYEGAPVEELRLATRRAFEELVSQALERKVAFLVISGDIWDGEWRDYGTGLFFARQMARLKDGGIRSYTIRGNHDARAVITKQLQVPQNVHEFASNAPETVTLEEYGVAIHGQSFATRAVEQNLAANYPPALSGYFNIGLLHTSLDGREGHAPYAPCSLEDLLGRGYDYWALGHVHQREVVHEDPHVIFSGVLQGRHIAEHGAKGCTLVTVDNGRVLRQEHLICDVLRWARLRIDLAGCTSEGAVCAEVQEKLSDLLAESEGRLLAVRMHLDGETALHTSIAGDLERWTQMLRQVAVETAGERIWVEKIQFRTLPLHRGGLSEGPLSEMAQLLKELEQDAELRDGLADSLKRIDTRCAAAFRAVNEEGLVSDEGLNEILSEARDLVLARLSGQVD